MEKIQSHIESKETDPKKMFLDRFRDLRYNYLEDFPEEILRPEDTDYHKYKCRTNYFASISSGIARLEDVLSKANCHMSENAKEKCDEFLAFCETLKGRQEKYTIQEINKANEILDILIKELS